MIISHVWREQPKRVALSTSLALATLAVILTAWSLTAVGQQVASTQIAGGSRGRAFSDALPSTDARVAEVRVRAGDAIDAIQIVYSLADGRTVAGTRHGGSGGSELVFTLDSDEYVTGLSGRYGDTIDSLRIHTNKRVSEVLGGGGGARDYRIEVPSGNQAIGFVGRAGDLLDAVGLAYAPISTGRLWGASSSSTTRSSQIPQTSGMWSGGAIAPGTEQLVQVFRTSTAGGGGGLPFGDDEIPVGTRISAIRVRTSDRIDSVQAIYQLPDGQSVEGASHGGLGGRENLLQLDADEYVTGVSGRCGTQIDSLRIHTNKRTSQLLGGSGGSRDYRIDIPVSNQSIGFAGRAGRYLDAIGLTYSPATSFRTYPRRSRRP